MANKYYPILDDKDPALRKKADLVGVPLTKKDLTILNKLLKYVVDSHDEALKAKYG